MVRDVGIDNVEHAVMQSKVTFVDCWAPWCKPCLKLSSILEELEVKYSDNPDVGFLKIDVHQYQEYGTRNNIYAIPCVLVFFDGEPAQFEDPSSKQSGNMTDRLVGVRPFEQYESVIEQLLGT